VCSPGRSWTWTPAAGGPIHAHAGQRWHFAGDSITNFGWFSAVGGFVDQINALVGGGGIVVTSNGIGGEKTIDMASRVHEQIAIYNPEVIVVEIGYNDMPIGVPLTVFRAAYDSILVGCRAECPGAQIMCISTLLGGEQWRSGPLRWDISSEFGIGQPYIENYNAQIAASAAAFGAAYVDVRTPALTYESVNNTPEPGVASGVLTVDGIHPSNAGKLLMANAAILQVVTP